MGVRIVERVILHLDMDAFYAAVEVREDPSLAGKPLIIGHRGRRGVVSTCSYEAREYGVHSALPSAIAERRCPHAIWLRGRMSLYVEVSRGIRRVLDDFSPRIEPLSIDEAFIDLTGIARDLTAGCATAGEIKKRIEQEHRLTSSVGVAPNKFLAKLASDLDKPDGLTVLPIAALPDKLWPLPVRHMWGVGPKMAERLDSAGISKIGDLLRVPQSALIRITSESTATHLRALARGEDDRPVNTHRRAKSISEERTYEDDLTDPDAIDRALLARADGVARQLRRNNLTAHTVQIKVRTADYTTWTRAETLAAATDLTEPIVETARRLLATKINLGGHGIRLLGVGVSSLEPRGSGQQRLFTTPAEDRARRSTRAADLVRDRLGEGSVTRARLLPRR